MAIFATYFHAFMDYGHTVTRGPLLLRTMNFYYYSQKAAKNFRFFQIFFFFFSSRQPYTWHCISGTSVGLDRVFSLMLWCDNISHDLSNVCHFSFLFFSFIYFLRKLILLCKQGLAQFHLFFWFKCFYHLWHSLLHTSFSVAKSFKLID